MASFYSLICLNKKKYNIHKLDIKITLKEIMAIKKKT